MPTAAEARAELERRRSKRERGTGSSRRRLGSRDQSAVSRLIEQGIPNDELEDDELHFANTRVRSLEHADRMQLQRDQIDRMAPLGTGRVSRPFANMAGDPTKRESIGENLEAFGENLGDLGREAMRAMPTGLPSQEEWQEGFRLAGEDFSGAQAGVQRAAQAAPGQVSRAAQAAPGALRLGGERLMANVMADPVGRELAAVAPLGPFAPAALPSLPNTRDAMREGAVQAPRVAGEIGRAVTYGPWKDERQLQYELDAARFMEEAGFGDPEQTRELADEGLRQTGWAGLNLAFAPLDVPVVARGAGAVASRLGGRQAAEAPMQARRLGAPPVIEGEFSAVDAAESSTGAQRDLFPDSAPGPVRVHHGTHDQFSPEQIGPWSHFGTEESARQRLRGIEADSLLHELSGRPIDTSAGRVLPYEITGRRISVGDEYPTEFRSMEDVADLLRRGQHITPDEHAWAVEPLQQGRRYAGRDADEIVGERLRELTARHDIGAIGYRNAVEDKGSISYLVPDPANVRPSRAPGSAATDPLGGSSAPVIAGGIGGALGTEALFGSEAEAGDGSDPLSDITVPVLGAGIGAAAFGALARGRGGRLAQGADSVVGMSGGAPPRRLGRAVEEALPEGSVSDDPLRGVNNPPTPSRNARGTGRAPTEYSRQNYARILDAAEEMASANNGRLPNAYLETLAQRTGYAPQTLSVVLGDIRSGRFGAEMAERAGAIRGLVGRPAVNREFIAEHMDADLSSQQMLERLNAYRAERGLEPTTLNTVKATMSQIRSGARGSPIATTAAIGGTALGSSMLMGDAEAQEGSPELAQVTRDLQARRADMEVIERASRTEAPDDVMAAQRILRRAGLYSGRIDGQWGGLTTGANNQYQQQLDADIAGLERREAYLSTRPTEEELSARHNMPTYALIGGAVAGHLAHFPGQWFNRGANALRAGSMNRLATSGSPAERAANMNAIWERGGAPAERLPFNLSESGQFSPNRNVAPESSLFQPRSPVAPYLSEGDLLLGTAALGEAGITGNIVLPEKERELQAAREALEAEKTGENYQRGEDLENEVAQLRAMQRAGLGFLGGQVSRGAGSALLREPTYLRPRPDWAMIQTERGALNRQLRTDAQAARSAQTQANAQTQAVRAEAQARRAQAQAERAEAQERLASARAAHAQAQAARAEAQAETARLRAQERAARERRKRRRTPPSES